MKNKLASAEEFRAMALLFRQQAAHDPSNSWRLLAEAERWEYLAIENPHPEARTPATGRIVRPKVRPPTH